MRIVPEKDMRKLIVTRKVTAEDGGRVHRKPEQSKHAAITGEETQIKALNRLVEVVSQQMQNNNKIAVAIAGTLDKTQEIKMPDINIPEPTVWGKIEFTVTGRDGKGQLKTFTAERIR